VKITETSIRGVRVFEPAVYSDGRGIFFETWHRERYAAAGLDEQFVQDNVSLSRHGVMRGLHYQHPNGQGKLIVVLRGEIYDVAVDIRNGSPTFGKWVGVTLNDQTRAQLYVPPGFAHGFQVISSEALVLYKCTQFYDSRTEHSLLWSDEDLAIDWRPDPVVSEKDLNGTRLRDLSGDDLPQYVGA
jgi:dTDP-4-dehydrorhamnose 3,5-epimerase